MFILPKRGSSILLVLSERNVYKYKLFLQTHWKLMETLMKLTMWLAPPCPGLVKTNVSWYDLFSIN